jgi:hypothetical protein
MDGSFFHSDSHKNSWLFALCGMLEILYFSEVSSASFTLQPSLHWINTEENEKVTHGDVVGFGSLHAPHQPESGQQLQPRKLFELPKWCFGNSAGHFLECGKKFTGIPTFLLIWNLFRYTHQLFWVSGSGSWAGVWRRIVLRILPQ